MKKLCVILFLLPLVTASIYNIKAKTVDLLDVYTLALKSSNEVQISLLGIDSAEQGSSISFSSLLPQADLTISQYKINEFPVLIDGQIEEYREWKREFFLELSQVIYNSQLLNQYRASKVEIDIQRLNYSQSIQTLLMTLLEAYFGLLKEQDTLKVSKSKLKTLKNYHLRSKSQMDSGLVPKADYLATKRELDLADIEMELVKERINNNKMLLSKLTGSSIEQISPIKDKQLINPDLPDFESLKEKVFSGNLDLKTQKTKAEKQVHELSSQKGGYYPSLKLGLSYKETDIPSQEPERTYVMSLSWSIFDGFATASAVRQKTIEQAILAKETREKEIELEDIFKQTYFKAARTKKNISIYREIVLTTEEILRHTEKLQERGLKTVIDKIEAQEKFSQMSLELNNNVYEFLLSKATLFYYSGALSPETMNEFNSLLVPKK